MQEKIWTWVPGLTLLPLVIGCGSNLNDALFQAAETGARTALDVLIADLYADLPDIFTLPPGPGESVGDPDTGDDGGATTDGGPATDGGDVDLSGDVENGAATFTANSCSTCHCEDASGDCLAAAPNLQGTDSATLREWLQGETPHAGGKSPDLTGQDFADLQAFLADQAGP